MERDITEVEYDVEKREVRHRECPFCGEYSPAAGFKSIVVDPTIRAMKIVQKLLEHTDPSPEERHLESEVDRSASVRTDAIQPPDREELDKQERVMELRAQRSLTLGEIQRVLQSLDSTDDVFHRPDTTRVCPECAESISNTSA